MLGDGIWEGMRLQEGVWYCFGEHLGRFSNSCKAISLDIGMDKVGIAEAMRQTAEVSDGVTRLPIECLDAVKAIADGDRQRA